jgi:putative endopeptidase
MGDVLPEAFLMERAAFRSAMVDSASNPSRASHVTRVVGQKLGMPLGRLYCQRFLSAEAREQARAVVRAVKAAMEVEISSGWVGASQAARDRALHKLRAMRMQVGFPDSWPETPNVTIRPDAFAANVMALNRQALLARLAGAGKPAPETHWPVPPQTSNAVYSATDNALTLPAGLLRPPFFSARYDDALNFGGLGSIAGHEMGHAFDRVGQQFDALGRLTTSPLQLPRALSEDASGLQADECLADRLGLKAAYRAFAASGSGPGVRGGYTAEQRFFLSYARVWATSTTAEFDRWRVERGAPHPRPQERVNQAVKSLPEFRQAFPETYEDSSAQ